MSTRRRSTVHDFSTLRLHPDGSRVPISSPTRTTLPDPRMRNTGRDIRGNRVARDAAGLGVVPKRVVMHGDDNSEVQNIKPRVPRRSKRRRIDADVGFLGDSGNRVRRTSGDTVEANGGAMNWPVPSSVRPGRAFFFCSFFLDARPLIIHSVCWFMQDLLKCVHYFASQYYAAQGLMSNRSRKYRDEVRQRNARHVQGAAEAGTDADADAEDEDEEDFEEDSGKEDLREEEVVKGRGKNEGKGATPESVPDMYKALDGSALVAIGTSILADCTREAERRGSPGMLLQEHISALLNSNIPLGWEEEMEAAGFVPVDRSAVLDHEETDDVERANEETSFESDYSDKD